MSQKYGKPQCEPCRVRLRGERARLDRADKNYLKKIACDNDGRSVYLVYLHEGKDLWRGEACCPAAAKANAISDYIMG